MLCRHFWSMYTLLCFTYGKIRGVATVKQLTLRSFSANILTTISLYVDITRSFSAFTTCRIFFYQCPFACAQVRDQQQWLSSHSIMIGVTLTSFSQAHSLRTTVSNIAFSTDWQDWVWIVDQSLAAPPSQHSWMTIPTSLKCASWCCSHELLASCIKRAGYDWSYMYDYMLDSILAIIKTIAPSHIWRHAIVGTWMMSYTTVHASYRA